MGQELNELNAVISYIDEKQELFFQKIIAYIRPNEDEMSERQASDEFGSGFIEWCVASGLIVPLRAGKHKNSRKVYSRFLLNKIKMKLMDENIRRIERYDARGLGSACVGIARDND